MPTRKHKLPKTRKTKKFKLLLDIAFAHPNIFRSLIKKANVKHARHDFNLSPEAEDKHIYQLASDMDRIVITHDHDFKRLVKPNMASVLIVDSQLTNKLIDATLVNFIRGKDPSDFKGKATKI